MTQVNLLPWREEARQVKQIRFLILSGLAIGIAIFTIAVIHLFMARVISSQHAVNGFLQAQLTYEKSVVVNLKKQQEEKNTILGQLNYGYALQKRSFKAVSIMNMLSNAIPDGVSLIKISREGNKVIIIGKTQSATGVTTFMNNIEATKQFYQPVLTKIANSEVTKENPTDEDSFQIEVVQKD